MVAAITANRTWDDPKNHDARAERLANIERSYREGIEILYSRKKPEEIVDPMKTDPLFRPLGMQAVELNKEISRPVNDAEGMGRQLLG